MRLDLRIGHVRIHHPVKLHFSLRYRSGAASSGITCSTQVFLTPGIILGCLHSPLRLFLGHGVHVCQAVRIVEVHALGHVIPECRCRIHGKNVSKALDVGVQLCDLRTLPFDPGSFRLGSLLTVLLCCLLLDLLCLLDCRMRRDQLIQHFLSQLACFQVLLQLGISGLFTPFLESLQCGDRLTGNRILQSWMT